MINRPLEQLDTSENRPLDLDRQVDEQVFSSSPSSVSGGKSARQKDAVKSPTGNLTEDSTRNSTGNSTGSETRTQDWRTQSQAVALLLLKRFWKRLVHNWNAKLASLILAFLVWSLISGNQNSVRQVTVQVPLTVMGTSVEALTYPIPESIEVVISGTNQRLDDLRIRDVTARLDLRNVSGEFQKAVRVSVPRFVTVESVEPRLIAGELE